MELSAARARRGGARFAARLALIILVLALGGYLLFGSLGTFHIVDYDEARHGVNAYEMIKNNDYIVHTYAGEPDMWNLKPPLSFWCIALSYRIFGYTPFALRFFSALSTMLAMAAVACWAWRRLGYLPALIAAAFFVCTSGLYYNHFARFGDADSQYQLCFTLSMLAMLASDSDFRRLYISAACFALAFMLKATHALIIPLVCLAYMLCAGRVKELSLKRIALLALIGLAPISAWAAARYARDGLAFFSNMLSVDVVNRLGSSSVSMEKNGVLGALWYFIGTVLPQITPIWVALAAVAATALTCVVRRARLTRELRNVFIGILLWIFVPIIAYSVAQAKYLWYIFSVFAALSALMAACARAVLDSGVKRAWVRLGAAITAAALFIGIYPTIVRTATLDDPHPYQDILISSLDRDMDSGTHMYVQYNETVGDEPITAWMPADMLAALFAGDVECLEGGMDAFMNDEEPAMLLIAETNNLAELYEALNTAMLRVEDGGIYILEK